MSVHTRLVKISAPVTNDAELEDFVRTAKKQRNQQTLHGILNPVAGVTNPLVLNPKLNRTLDEAGLGAAGQTGVQNFLGMQGSGLAAGLGAAAGGLGLGLLGRKIGQLPRFAGTGIGSRIFLTPRKYTTPATIAGALGGSFGGGYAAFGVSEKNRSNRLENRIRDAYAAKQQSG